MTDERAPRPRSIILTGVAIGVITGLVVGLVGSWLDFHPAVTSGVIAAVTSATMTSLHLQSKKGSK